MLPTTGPLIRGYYETPRVKIKVTVAVQKFKMYERVIWFARGKTLICTTLNEEKQKIIYNFAKGSINFFDAGLVLAYC